MVSYQIVLYCKVLVVFFPIPLWDSLILKASPGSICYENGLFVGLQWISQVFIVLCPPPVTV